MTIYEAIRGARSPLNSEKTVDIEQIGGLFPRGYMSIIASPPGIGKTWLSLYFTCELSRGGEYAYNNSSGNAPSRILMMAGEGGEILIQKRLNETNWQYEKDNFILFSSLALNEKKIPYMLNTNEGKGTFQLLLQEYRPDILWIDTLISFHTIDESKQNEMTAIYLFLNNLARYYQCAVVVNHHTRKRSNKAPEQRELTQDDVIGTSAGIRLAFNVFICDTQPLASNTIRFTHVKSWDKKISPILFTFIQGEDGGTDFAIKPTDNVMSTRETILNYLKKFNFGAYQRASDVAQMCKVSQATARYHLQNFAKQFQWLEEVELYGERVFHICGVPDEDDIIVRM